MSDLLQVASDALGVPPELLRRSAAARAQANGTTVDDTLAAWSGGAPAPTAGAPPAAPAEPAAAEETPAETVEAAAPAAAPPLIEQPAVAPPVVTAPVVVEPEVELEPAPMALRVKTAVRIGAWTGAALGVVGFLAATAFWAPNTVVLPESGPLVQTGPTGLIIGLALVSVVFGAIVAGVSRAVTAWTNPAMELTTSRTATIWVGGALGLVLGIVAAAVLTGLGTPVEGSDPPLVQLPVLPTLLVMVIGGAILGAITAMVPQLLGVPVAVDDSETEEVTTVRARLGHAIGIPLAGLILLALLVLPFAYALIQSNHLAENGGAMVAIIAAAGILGFSALAGTKPQMRISFGDLLWAIIGIGVVLVIIISVLASAGGDDEEAPAATEEAVVMLVV